MWTWDIMMLDQTHTSKVLVIVVYINLAYICNENEI